MLDRMSAAELLPRWLEAIAAVVPGLAFFDAHTHTGSGDPDGFRSSASELLASLDPIGASAVVFTMHEPGGYRAANDRVLAEASSSNGRLVAFCRLDPRNDPVSEAERCLDAGARGIKLHPRSDGFTLDEAPLRGIFAVAGERRVPVLIHAGRGIPALGEHALALADEFPGAKVILAHAAISDLGWIWTRLPEFPNVLVDTSWWNPADLAALFALVPPGQILFASDAPYGPPAVVAVMALRFALQAGLTPEQVRSVAGAQIERLVAGDEPADLGPAPGRARLTSDMLVERVSSCLMVGFGRLMAGGVAEEQVALARLACHVPADDPSARVLAAIDRLLEGYADRPPPPGSPRPFDPAAILPIILAAVLARTPDVPAPGVDLGESSLTVS
jgi:predicted TIM-barrel fold metal-dependent hydrolase